MFVLDDLGQCSHAQTESDLDAASQVRTRAESDLDAASQVRALIKNELLVAMIALDREETSVREQINFLKRQFGDLRDSLEVLWDMYDSGLDGDGGDLYEFVT